MATLPEVGTAVDALAAAGRALPVEAWLGGAGGGSPAAPGAGGHRGDPMAAELRGDRVVLRAPAAADIPALSAVMATPEVRRWWVGERDEDSRARVLAPEDGTTTWVVTVDGELIGMVQASEEDDPEYRHAGVDIALHPAWHGRGLGPDAIRTVARHLLASAATTASRSTRRRRTPPPSAATSASGSGRSASCARTSAATTARGTTAY